jgi:predicted amidohydrolase YtcJ
MPPPPDAPPLLLTNATVLDPSPRPAACDTVAVAGGRIVAVGDRAAAASSLPSDHRVVDLGGATLVPGFIDAHLHPLPMCFFEHQLDLSTCSSIDEVLSLLSDRAATEPADGWVVGLRVDDEALRERRLPTRVELDAVANGRAVVLMRRDGHHAIGSSRALAAAGFDATTPDPPGGVIHHAPDGTLSGLCGEAAAQMLLATVPLPEWDAFEAALDRVVAAWLRHGITGISAMCQTSAEGPAGAAGALEHAAWAGLLDRVPLDVQTILIATNAATMRDLRQGPMHRPDAGRRLDAVKLFLDGTLGGRTACLHRPYADGDGGHDDHGMLTLPTERAYAQLVDAHTAGFQVCIHAIGDRANRTAAELYARLLTEHPGPHRHRVEHASVLDDETIDLLGALDVTAVVQPISLDSESAWLAKRLGDERIDRVYPFRALLDAGVTVAGSSDAPIESSDALAAMDCAVDRRGTGLHHALTPVEALALYTQGAARARQVEDSTGTIDDGHRADLVVLSRDPRDGFAGVDVLATYTGGQLRYQAPAQATGAPTGDP